MTALAGPMEQLLRDAAEWRLVGLLLECPSADWRNGVAEIAREVNDPDLKEAAEHAQTEATEGLYHSTFGPGGPAPPREATHRDTLQLGYLIAELEAFYHSFGYPRDTREPPDHICVQAGFVAYLKFKEAYAAACGDGEAASVARDAGREFVSEHLASTAQPLAAALATSGVPYLEATARALARLAGPAKQRFLVLGPDLLETGGDTFGCGEAVAEEEVL